MWHLNLSKLILNRNETFNVATRKMNSMKKIKPPSSLD